MKNYAIEVDFKKFNRDTKDFTDAQLGAFAKLFFHQAENHGTIPLSIIIQLYRIEDADKIIDKLRRRKSGGMYYPHIKITEV